MMQFTIRDLIGFTSCLAITAALLANVWEKNHRLELVEHHEEERTLLWGQITRLQLDAMSVENQAAFWREHYRRATGQQWPQEPLSCFEISLANQRRWDASPSAESLLKEPNP